ncbi:MAG: 16S rRNA (cytidine(1402)-2'-O)-methyltransferase [Firmicutes bacterium]|nr:16S rRNA (cytidine(1402)-2'-O)-methyltransferase [Bacillota bacterium]
MGTLYLVSTPIGNIADITQRARDVLSQVSLVAAEDTRHTGLLLSRYGIKARLLSYHEHNEVVRVDQVLEVLARGEDVAVVSDAGTPVISDPGEILVRRAINAGHRIVPVPGPAAFLAALVASGLPASRFTFQGFLPRRSAERRAVLTALASYDSTLIFYEAPHRLRRMLEDVLRVVGDRPCALAREITKKFEEIRRGRVSEILEWVRAESPKGEFVLVVAGPQPAPTPESVEGPGTTQDGDQAEEEVLALIDSGYTTRDAIALVAREKGIYRRRLYRNVLAKQRKDT